jgi:hypothetical protein
MTAFTCTFGTTNSADQTSQGWCNCSESKYAYRTYLRERKYTKDQRDMLANFLHSRRDTLRVSPALDEWVNGTFVGYIRNLSYSRSYYFVDHDHPNEGTMLSLVLPGIVRKTMSIETTK